MSLFQYIATDNVGEFTAEFALERTKGESLASILDCILVHDAANIFGSLSGADLKDMTSEYNGAVGKYGTDSIPAIERVIMRIDRFGGGARCLRAIAGGSLINIAHPVIAYMKNEICMKQLWDSDTIIVTQKLINAVLDAGNAYFLKLIVDSKCNVNMEELVGKILVQDNLDMYRAIAHDRISSGKFINDFRMMVIRSMSPARQTNILYELIQHMPLTVESVRIICENLTLYSRACAVRPSHDICMRLRVGLFRDVIPTLRNVYKHTADEVLARMTLWFDLPADIVNAEDVLALDCPTAHVLKLRHLSTDSTIKLLEYCRKHNLMNVLCAILNSVPTLCARVDVIQLLHGVPCKLKLSARSVAQLLRGARDFKPETVSIWCDAFLRLSSPYVVDSPIIFQDLSDMEHILDTCGRYLETKHSLEMSAVFYTFAKIVPELAFKPVMRMAQSKPQSWDYNALVHTVCSHLGAIRVIGQLDLLSRGPDEFASWLYDPAHLAKLFSDMSTKKVDLVDNSSRATIDADDVKA